MSININVKSITTCLLTLKQELSCKNCSSYLLPLCSALLSNVKVPNQVTEVSIELVFVLRCVSST